jgi:arginine:ornithine antiporter/lysine permease
LIGAAFQVWMVFAAGLVYILVSFITYIPGMVLYYRARKLDGDANPLKGSTGFFMVLIALGAIVSIVGLAAGFISV